MANIWLQARGHVHHDRQQSRDNGSLVPLDQLCLGESRSISRDQKPDGLQSADLLVRKIFPVMLPLELQTKDFRAVL